MTEPLRGSVWPEVPDHSVLSGRTAIISGASRGIGAAVARTLAGAGVAVVLLAKSGTGSPGRLPGVVDDVAAEINATGGRALPHVGDLRSDDDVAAAIAATVAEFGGIDIVVNNAASFDTTPTASISMKRYDLLNQINARVAQEHRPDPAGGHRVGPEECGRRDGRPVEDPGHEIPYRLGVTAGHESRQCETDDGEGGHAG